MQGTGQERTKGAHSPQATQTMDGFQKFVHRINRTREQYWATQMDKWEAEVESKYLQNLEQSEVKDSLVGGAQPLEKPKELKPVLITHDNGAEFGGTKQEGAVNVGDGGTRVNPSSRSVARRRRVQVALDGFLDCYRVDRNIKLVKICAYLTSNVTARRLGFLIQKINLIIASKSGWSFKI